MSWDSQNIEFRVREVERQLEEFREVVQTNQIAIDVDTGIGDEGRGLGANSPVVGPISYPWVFNPVNHRRFDTEPPPGTTDPNVFNTLFIRATHIVVNPKTTEDPIQIRTFADAIHDGQMMKVTVISGKTLEILAPSGTDGNVDISADITGITTSDVLEFVFSNQASTAGFPNGAWIRASGIGGGGDSGGTSTWKQPVRVATTANITLSGEQTIDGILTSTDRILVKDQTTTSANGIYVTATGAWTRATDMDNTVETLSGITMYVEEGTLNSLSVWKLITVNPIILDTTGLTFLPTINMSGIGDIFNLDTLTFNSADTIKLSSPAGVTLELEVPDTGAFDFFVDRPNNSTPRFGIQETLVSSNVPFDINLNEIRFDGITDPGDPTTTGDERYLFANSDNSNHLSARTSTGIVDLEVGTSFIGFSADADLDMNNFDIFDVGDIDGLVNSVIGGTTPFQDIFADRHLVTTAAINATKHGLARNVDVIFINYPSSTGSFVVKENAVDKMILSTTGVGNIDTLLQFPVSSAPDEFKMEFGFGINQRGLLQYDGTDTILDRQGAGASQGTRIMAGGIGGIFVRGDGDIQIFDNVDMFLNDFQAVGDINATTGTITTLATSLINSSITTSTFIDFTALADIDIKTTATGDNINIDAFNLLSLDGDQVLIDGTNGVTIDHTTGAQLIIGSVSARFSGAPLILAGSADTIDFQTAIAGSGVSATGDNIKLFNDSDTGELSVKHSTGGAVSLEAGGGGGATRELDNLLTTAINAQLNLNNTIDIVPLTDLGSDLGDTTHAFSIGYINKVVFDVTTKSIDSVGSLDLEFKVPSLGDMKFIEDITQFWRLDGGENQSIFSRDIALTTAESIRADGTGEIGFWVTNTTSAVGAFGTMQMPVDTGSASNAAGADADFGNKVGCFGLYLSSGGTPIFVIKFDESPSTWATMLLLNGLDIAGGRLT